MYNLYTNNIWIDTENKIGCVHNRKARARMLLPLMLHGFCYILCPRHNNHHPYFAWLVAYIYRPRNLQSFRVQTDNFQWMLLQTGIRRTCGNIENMLLKIQRSVRNLEFHFVICRLVRGQVTICHEFGNSDQNVVIPMSPLHFMFLLSLLMIWEGGWECIQLIAVGNTLTAHNRSQPAGPPTAAASQPACS